MIEQLRQNELIRRIQRQDLAKKQMLFKNNYKKKNIHIVYVMTHVGVCGGVKIILEHANHLKRFGAKVTIVSHFPKPTWFQIDADYIQVPFGIELAKGIPVCDVIVATYWDHIQSCIETGIAPVVYFEQGDFHLYDLEKASPQLQEFIKKQYELPKYVITVSYQTAKVIREVYNREALVFHNSVDERIFNEKDEAYSWHKPYILMIGSDNTEFKGIRDIIGAYRIVKKSGFDVDLIWITPSEPSCKYEEVAKVLVNPKQHIIASLYRGAVLYVSGSHYESFPLPGLEAMACGCPLVTTANIGVQEYAKDNYNSLFAEIKNPSDLANKIISILSDNELKDRIIENARKTADNFKWNKIIPSLLDYYKEVAEYSPIKVNDYSQWDIYINENAFTSEQDSEKFYRFLSQTEADVVKVPFIYDLLGKHKIARWEVAAKRKKTYSSIIQKCYCKVTCNNLQNLTYFTAYKYFSIRDFNNAFNEFKRLYSQQVEASKKLIYFKWIILCLIEMECDEEANELLNSIIDSVPDNSDIYYLKMLISVLNGNYEDARYLYNVIDILGEAVSYDEFFDSVVYLANDLYKSVRSRFK